MGAGSEYAENQIHGNPRTEARSCIGGYRRHQTYLSIKIVQDGTLDAEIKRRNRLGRRSIALLNSILWNKYITNENEKRIYNAIVTSIVSYGSEVWPLKEWTEKRC